MSWLRLEGAGVDADLREGLSARLADPYWLLARQWQVGEFTGEDAANPVEVRVEARYQPVGEVRLGRAEPRPVDPESTPLEALVEAEDARRGAAGVRMAAEAGLQLLRLAEAEQPAPGLRDRLRTAFPLQLAADDGLDPRGRAELELLAARSFDAAALMRQARAGKAVDPALARVLEDWLAAWENDLVAPDSSATAWLPERMEYAFAIAAPRFAGGLALDAPGHAGGRLDWHAFDVGADAPPELPEDSPTRSIATVAAPLRYAGMPASRWWAFEDGAVFWGDVEGGPEDLARYLVAAFATVGGDDWRLIPLDLPRGVVAQVIRVEVLDSFGATHKVRSTAARDHKREGGARAWRLFELSGDPAPASGHAPRLLAAATLAPHDESRPVEEVLLLRDEGANLGWAVERIVESASGRPAVRRREPPPAAAAAAPADGDWGYDLSTPVPAHFVPLVPVRLEADRPGIRLQRGRMATQDGTTGARGLVLEPQRHLLLHEEEVPASGARVTRAYQLCRSPDGGVHLWMGRTKRPGRGPARSGLAFDVLAIPDPED